MFNIQSGFNKIISSITPESRRLFGSADKRSFIIFRNVFVLITLVALSYALTGCGASVAAGKSLDASQGSFTASPNTVDFGSVSVGSPATNTVSLVNSSSDPVVVSQLSISGNSSFAVANQVRLPFTLAAGSTTALKVKYNPQSTTGDSGNLVITSNSTAVPTATVKLHGQGWKNGSGNSPVLSAIACNSGSLTGAGADACTVTLNTAAPNGGFNVGLTSSNAAVSMPPTVTVPANATSIGFTATASAVTSVQSATLTASAGGATKTFALELQPSSAPTAPTLTVSSASLAFGNVALNTPAKQNLTLSSAGTAPLTISSATLSGTGFTMSGTTLPVTLNPGQTASLTVQFDPASAGAFTGQIAITSNSSTGAATKIALSGTGTSTSAPALSALSCSSGSMTGAGSDTCTVSLSAAAPSGGLSVSLASSNKAVTVPASVSVPANATSAGFSATVAAVSSAQSATLTATASGVSKTFALQLGTASGSTLSINASSISFGSVALNTPSTQSVTLTATGTGAITVSSASVSGTGFSLSGAKFPMTVNPGTPATLSVQFDPTSSGAASGQLIIANSSSNNANATISLSGTGATLQIALNWDAPSSSSDSIAGYNVYRAVSGSSSYAVVKSGNTQTSYTDSSVKSGTTYQYYVTSVDSSGDESTPSNTATVAVP